jgi:hypothetical protein
MAFFTALLVILTLTGKPVVNALCVTWCDTSSEILNCREEAIAHMSAAELTVAETPCTTFVTTVPFVKEDVRGIGQVAVEDVAVPAAVPDRSDPLALTLAHQWTSNWSEPALILRL